MATEQYIIDWLKRIENKLDTAISMKVLVRVLMWAVALLYTTIIGFAITAGINK